MSYVVRSEIGGLKEALSALDQVSNKIRKKALKKGIAKATRVLRSEARRRAVKKTGLLRKSLAQKVIVVKKTDTVLGMVGPKRGLKQEVIRDGKHVLSDPVRYAHLVELGTSHSAARPFLRPALDAVKDQMVDLVAEAVNEALNAGG